MLSSSVVMIPWAWWSSSDIKNKGFFLDEAALLLARPNWIATPSDRNGRFAILWSTDTVWIWDSNTNARVDSWVNPPSGWIPVWTISAFAWPILPANNILCDGGEYPQATYPALFAYVWFRYGTPVNPANFLVPNLTNRFIKWDTGADIGTSAGSNTLSVGQLPQHSHTLFVNNGSADTGIPAGNFLNSTSGGGEPVMDSTGASLEATNSNSIGLSGSGSPHEHPHLVLRYGICFEEIGVGSVQMTPTLQQVSAAGANSTIRLQFNGDDYALVTDIPAPLTNEEIQDAAFSILTDTATVDLNYDDASNTVTAEVINNSITNAKLAQMPAKTVKWNDTNAIANPQDIPIQEIIMAKAALVNWDYTIIDSRLTTDSALVWWAFNSSWVSTSVPLKYTPANWSMLLSTGQITDTANIGFTILI